VREVGWAERARAEVPDRLFEAIFDLVALERDLPSARRRSRLRPGSLPACPDAFPKIVKKLVPPSTNILSASKAEVDERRDTRRAEGRDYQEHGSQHRSLSEHARRENTSCARRGKACGTYWDQCRPRSRATLRNSRAGMAGSSR